jgi:DeoR/GlpR family transcriptional regulator of sugar metabolism
MNFIWAMRLSKAKERIAFILDYYPELRHLKQHELAELIGLERETVCRNLKHLKTEGG